MLELILLTIRAVQALFAVIELGLTGHVASYYATPSQDSFLLFTSIWTLLVLVYLALSPRFMNKIANVFALLAIDALTMLFWFAGFIAMAVFHSNLTYLADYYYIGGCSRFGDVCGVVEAAVVFGAFEWILFVVTTVFSALDAFRNRNRTDATADPAGMK